MSFYAEQKDGLVERVKGKKTDIFAKDDKRIKTHYHRGHELYFLIRGNTKYFIGDEIYYLKEGDMVFVPKGVLHITCNDEGTYISRILITFTDDMLDEHMKPYLEELYENKFICFSEENLPRIEELLRKMEMEYGKKLPDYEYIIKMYIQELLIFISRYRIPPVETKLTEAQELIKKVTYYINDNFDKPLREEDTAEIFAVSKSHFCRKFKSVTGLRYNEYVTNVRITNSEKLLRETHLPITEISQRCGFNDSNYFASVFKRLKGITPYKYAKLYRANRR